MNQWKFQGAMTVVKTLAPLKLIPPLMHKKIVFTLQLVPLKKCSCYRADYNTGHKSVVYSFAPLSVVGFLVITRIQQDALKTKFLCIRASLFFF